MAIIPLLPLVFLILSPIEPPFIEIGIFVGVPLVLLEEVSPLEPLTFMMISWLLLP